jgi:membrane protein
MKRKQRRSIAKLLRSVGESWLGDEAPRMAAALAYYTTFSVGPLLLISIAIAGLVFDPDSARREILNQLTGLIGPNGAEIIATVVEHAGRNPSGNILGTIAGGVVLLFGASGVFGELQTSLNKIWKVEHKKGRGVLGWLKDRFFNFTMVLGIAFVLLVSLVVSAGLQALGGLIDGWFGDVQVMKILYAAVSFIILAVLFALIFKVVPDANTRWTDVWLGAGITAALFTAGKFLIGLYLGKSGVSGKYGAAGSLVVFLIWIYYSAQILFLGAEFTRVWAENRGHGIPPDSDAQRVRRKTEVVGSRS